MGVCRHLPIHKLMLKYILLALAVTAAISAQSIDDMDTEGLGDLEIEAERPCRIRTCTPPCPNKQFNHKADCDFTHEAYSKQTKKDQLGCCFAKFNHVNKQAEKGCEDVVNYCSAVPLKHKCFKTCLGSGSLVAGRKRVRGRWVSDGTTALSRCKAHARGRRLLSTETEPTDGNVDINDDMAANLAAIDNDMVLDLELATGAKTRTRFGGGWRRRRMTSWVTWKKVCNDRDPAFRRCLDDNRKCNNLMKKLEDAVVVAEKHEHYYANQEKHWAAAAKRHHGHSAVAKKAHQVAVKEARAKHNLLVRAAAAEKTGRANLRAADADSKKAAKAAAAATTVLAKAAGALKTRTAAHDKAKLRHLNAIAHKNKSDKVAAAAAAEQKKAVATHKTAADKATAAALAAGAAALDFEETGASVKNAMAEVDRATKAAAAKKKAQAKADAEVKAVASLLDEAKLAHLQAVAAYHKSNKAVAAAEKKYKKAKDEHKTHNDKHADAVLKHNAAKAATAKAKKALAGR